MANSSDIRQKLDELAHNLWWTWNPEIIDLFRDMDPDLWREANHNPIIFFKRLGDTRVTAFLADEINIARVERGHNQLTRYLSAESLWGDTHAGPLARRPVAYFCAEFGLHESLPIYSGGLGILAGDHLKSASDLGVPLIGIGLFYREGYFRQRIDAQGRQHAEPLHNDPALLPLELIRDAAGEPRIIEVPLSGSAIRAQIWQAQVGRVRLLLLDAAADDAHPELRDLTSRLYGGGERMRLLQELLLGVGGMRALEAIGSEPGVIHLNEGHSAFAVLELAHRWAKRDNVSLWEAFSEAAARTVFTTHTPVPAGHDRFDPDMFDDIMGEYRKQLGIDREALLSLGRVNTANQRESFCMTVLALKGSRKANGVSALHGRVSRRMWKVLYPLCHSENQIPIGHITNGVHMLSWLAPEMYDLFVRHFGWDWPQHICYPEMWAKIEQVSDRELWDVRRIVKTRLIRLVRRRLVRQRRRWRAPAAEIERLGQVLDPDALLIGFARRFATYKRAGLIFQDLERLKRLITHAERPVQLVFAGKAHPADQPGQDVIREICQLAHDPELSHHVVFLEDYNIRVTRHLVQGVDLWLNTPRRPLEASGTSGMKAVPNGVLNFSVLDGWWPEAYDGHNGFAIESTSLGADTERIDRRDAVQMMDTLENEILPLYYARDAGGLPKGWIRRVKRAIHTLAWRFNTDRMVMDYTLNAYLPCAEAATADMQMT